jgi:hypothetical protein
MQSSIAAPLPAAERAAKAAPEPRPRGPIDHRKLVPRFDLAASMAQAKRRSGKSYLVQAGEIMRLFFGPGGIQPFEYYYYNLYDDRYTTEQKRAFVGGQLRIRVTNTILDDYHYGIGVDKLTFHACMAGLGLPLPRLLAVLHADRAPAGSRRLRDTAELADYLRGAPYPLFGKPTDRTASVGTVALERHLPGTDEIELADGRRFAVERLAEEAGRYLGRGYLLHERLSPAEEIARICGRSLSTVRFLILNADGEPKPLAATWRLPVADSHADVLWRGNLMAALEPASGTAVRVVRGSGLDLEELAHHPDSGAPILGRRLPMWDEARDLALSAARTVPALELTGWDVAVGDRGPVLIELEPDGGSPTVGQLASGRGLLDGPYGAWLAGLPKNHKRRRQGRRR